MLRNFLYVLLGLSLILASCKHDAPIPVNAVEDNYPPEVAKIIVGKCATSGCHNAASYSVNGGILMDTWEHLFQGGVTGSAVVPYSPDYSPLLYFINTDSSAGVVSEPRMPFGQGAHPLSKDEYNTIKNWIASGAPDKNGNIPFASEASTRQKVYVTIQGCDLLCVIDAKTKQVMRYTRLGFIDGVSESPHIARFSDDGKYAFATIPAGGIQRIDATTDAVINTIPLTGSGWNIVLPSKDGNKAITTDFLGGQIVYIDIENSEKNTIGNITGAHGLAANASFDTFYVTSQPGNRLYKINRYSSDKKLILLNGTTAVGSGGPSPHDLMMSPDQTKLFMTGELSNEVIVVDRATDEVIKKIPVGTFPQEIAFSKKYPYMFISCATDDKHTVVDPNSGNTITFEGSVHIINYQTLEHIGVIKGDFAYVHGISVDDQNGLIYISSKNPLNLGPQPHHVSNCGGKNGYFNVYDLATWKPLPARRYEIAPNPYGMDIRFK